ncbi:tRNA (adenosine(37)-N6)-threonylcarbamoyltransferase complex dimerization subunit type 1 TsaB [Parapusillimonas granuli]|uniref:[Ribosomal protein bS18]-alanine N-acetyltransferase n=1 Tax=Parapusillimonas granuli TaxID=380911 RepID=A0A853G0A0_9BURK|nr:tRNA (adenosine(37)-N6)-threonylcarbamoyltransferase complex dimerization subunit type 1 TsaB [Parapusillimonas granuli]MBB5216726.1 tRNA threonylcarbamoyladenosine biosynthesis protein TsaB [Parapusillimonas granuli]MEB2400055.1 tRNA (adenosine(37)-N6)-threonylcarbamoyltransferase complex dimerization subunit type 1 TsaB [Alcaligenaceae bacterium]NYT51785.1 tRNA (adenosine(37)-N6)-threonylcarbamoyltransferase complex dimerization subunit type 1 TsaB [Parapusillimonas granuli]
MTVHILALETSSSVCGVALLACGDGPPQVFIQEHDATGEHAERLLPMADDVMREAGIGRAELSAVAFGQGPGGFTGLRVACGVAQGIGYALGIPVMPVVSLLAVAERDRAAGASPGLVRVVVQDARMGEVYLGAYHMRGSGQAARWETLQAPLLLDAARVERWLANAWADWALAGRELPGLRLVGDALDAHPDLRRIQLDGAVTETGDPLRADAAAIACLALQAWRDGATLEPEHAMPLYVRDKVAYTTRERELGAGGNPRVEGPPVRIEPMLPEHLDDVAEIESLVQSFPWSRRNFQDGLEAGYAAYVARREGRTLGFYMSLYAPDVAHLLVIAVAPGEQKKGVGGRLLRHCEAEARAKRLPAIILEVRPSNRNALAFYQHEGYRQLATRRNYYPAPGGGREDACVMQKTL